MPQNSTIDIRQQSEYTYRIQWICFTYKIVFEHNISFITVIVDIRGTWHLYKQLTVGCTTCWLSSFNIYNIFSLKLIHYIHHGCSCQFWLKQNRNKMCKVAKLWQKYFNDIPRDNITPSEMPNVSWRWFNNYIFSGRCKANISLMQYCMYSLWVYNRK